VEVERWQYVRMSSAYWSFAQESQKGLVEGSAQATQDIVRVSGAEALVNKSVE
jgi:hypothetical protein